MRCNCELVCEHESFEARFGELVCARRGTAASLRNAVGIPVFGALSLGWRGYPHCCAA